MLRRKTNFNLGKSLRGARVASSIPIVALLLLGGMVVWGLAPVGVLSNEEVSAVGSSDGGVTTLAGWLSSSVTLTMSDKVEEVIEPAVDGTFKSMSALAHVQVNNSDYYEVSMHASSVDMTNPNVADAKISSITTASNAASFGIDQWGYSLSKNGAGVATIVPADSSTIYQPVAATATAIPGLGRQATINNVSDDYYTMNFGARVGTTLPAGTYSSTVMLSVVASPKLVTGFDRTDTMQGLTANVCREIGTDVDESKDSYRATDALGNEYYTKRLKDLRDGKYYWVAKLADGNCWMTQNLALDIPAEGLTSEMTALREGVTSWKPAEATRTPATPNRFTISECLAQADGEAQGIYGEGKTYANEKACLDTNAEYSWDEGVYVMAYPGMGDNVLWNGRTVEQGGLAGFADKKWLADLDVDSKMLLDGQLIFDVSSGWTASTDPNFTANHDGYAVDLETKTYDAHYLIGNYYQWLVATTQTVAEGKKVAVEGQSVRGSICAKGWQLPLSGASHNTDKNSYFNLIKSYAGDALKVGGAGGGNNAADTNNGYSSLSHEITSGVTVGDVILGTPMQFFLAGYVIPWSTNREVRHVGARAYFWSSAVIDRNYANDFHVSPWDVAPSIVTERAVGMPVRCLVNATE